MEELILKQLDRYPEMETQDVLKLLYQLEFGCEHIVKDASSASNRLTAEIRTLTAPMENEPLYEIIGEGLCRLNLRVAVQKLTFDEILSLFLACAENKRGTKDGFRARVKEFTRLCDREQLPFEPVEIELFMAGYDLKRCAPLSHSVRYHTLYKPAYRLVSQKQLKDLMKTKREK